MDYWTLLYILGGLMILDTLIGNRLFPAKVEILKRSDRNYVIRKTHRYFIFFRSCSYVNDSSGHARGILFDFSSIDKAAYWYQLDEAKIIANKFANQDSLATTEVAWSSKGKETKTL